MDTWWDIMKRQFGFFEINLALHYERYMMDKTDNPFTDMIALLLATIVFLAVGVIVDELPIMFGCLFGAVLTFAFMLLPFFKWRSRDDLGSFGEKH